jgi:hypothetical protein
MNDPAQEFANKVVDVWVNLDLHLWTDDRKRLLAKLIADSLCDEGWRSREEWLLDMRVMTDAIREVKQANRHE